MWRRISAIPLEDASNRADKLGSGLSVATVAMGNLISSGIQAALSGIQELGSAIWNLDEATEEYRVAQGKLTTAFEAAGYSGDAAQKSYTRSSIKSWVIRTRQQKRPSSWRSLPRTSRTLPSGQISRPASTVPLAMHSPSRA